MTQERELEIEQRLTRLEEKVDALKASMEGITAFLRNNVGGIAAAVIVWWITKG